jgi:hypothetical protein
MTTQEYIAGALWSPDLIDRFLDSDAHNWARYDSDLGYLPKTSTVRDGIDGSRSTYTYAQRSDTTRERLMINHADAPCRINTYGNSFTQCHQVSDGETWQEDLAAHFGEPIRNFGVGGHGVYQAYQRMLREESAETSADYVIFNVWIDDHFRSLYPWRWLHTGAFRDHTPLLNPPTDEASMILNNPWAHLRLDLESGSFFEEPNPCPTPESLYNLCDLDFCTEIFASTFPVQMQLAKEGVSDVRIDILRNAAEVLDMPAPQNNDANLATIADDLYMRATLLSSIEILKKVQAFCDDAGKKLMVFLSYSSADVVRACEGGDRWDTLFLNWVSEAGIPLVDTLRSHVEDFALFNLTPSEYINRYYIGHYSPVGNHFFAFAVKEALTEWLDPPPPTYRQGGTEMGKMAATLA